MNFKFWWNILVSFFFPLGTLFSFPDAVTLHGNVSIYITGYSLALDWTRADSKANGLNYFDSWVGRASVSELQDPGLEEKSYSRACFMSQGLPALLRLARTPRLQCSLVPVSPIPEMIGRQVPACPASSLPQCVPDSYGLSLTTTLWCGNCGLRFIIQNGTVLIQWLYYESTGK